MKKVSAHQQKPQAGHGVTQTGATVHPRSFKIEAREPAPVTLSKAKALPARSSLVEMPGIDGVKIRQSVSRSSLPILHREQYVLRAVKDVQQNAEAMQPQSGPQDWLNDDLKRKFAATVLAESAAGQAQHIVWIYYNDVTKNKGAAGLARSSAYSGKHIWYKIWLYMLGDTQYGSDALPKERAFEDFSSVENFCQKNQYMQGVGSKRASEVESLVEQAFAQPAKNPYAGWSGQGNLADFNNISNNDIYWTRARYYYWLQQEKKVTEIYVKVLPAGKSTQFLFHADKILEYFTTNKIKLPAQVKKYEP